MWTDSGSLAVYGGGILSVTNRGGLASASAYIGNLSSSLPVRIPCGRHGLILDKQRQHQCRQPWHRNAVAQRRRCRHNNEHLRVYQYFTLGHRCGTRQPADNRRRHRHYHQQRRRPRSRGGRCACQFQQVLAHFRQNVERRRHVSGHRWNVDKVGHTFTASSVTTGISNSAVALDLASVQRALIDDSVTGWQVARVFPPRQTP